MAHLSSKKPKILARLKRMQGQLSAIMLAVEADKDCSFVLQSLAACRGAMSGLTLDILEDHIEAHVVPLKGKWTRENELAVDETLGVIRSYLK